MSVANEQNASGLDEWQTPAKKGLLATPHREVIAFAVALLFVALGFAGIYIVAKVAEVKDGVVLVSLMIVPAVLYLLLSGRVSDLKGPGGLEVRLSEVANERIPLAGDAHGTSAIAIEGVRAVEKGRTESFVSRIRDITPEDPVVLTHHPRFRANRRYCGGRLRKGAHAVPALQVRRDPRLARETDLVLGRKCIPARDRGRCRRRHRAAEQHRASERGCGARISWHGRQYGDPPDQYCQRATDHGPRTSQRAPRHRGWSHQRDRRARPPRKRAAALTRRACLTPSLMHAPSKRTPVSAPGSVDQTIASSKRATANCAGRARLSADRSRRTRSPAG
jgi:hypothetical protein